MRKCYLPLLIMFFVSCNDDGFDLKNYSVNNQAINSIEQNIHDYIKTFRKTVSRNATNYTLLPFVYEGDTVMHIVNYGNGWDLFSNDKRMPMVVMSSDNGVFDMNDATMPPSMKGYIYSVADEIHQLRTNIEEESVSYGEWNIVSIENEEVDLDNVIVGPRAIGNAQPGEGYWQLIEISDPVQSESVTSRRTVTQWGQSYPWNLYIPFAEDNLTVKGPAGCVSVAVAQYLYYLHYKNNNPASTITSASYNSMDNIYTYSGSSSTVWDNMAKTFYESGTDAVAKFIGYVGKSIGTKYYSDAGEAYVSDAVEFINNLTGSDYYLSYINYSYVINELLSGRAVLARASAVDTNGKKVGHAFIIDRLKTEIITTTSTYGWVGTDNYGRDTNLYDMEGNVIGYSFFYEDDNSTETHSFMMNWGWNGYSDDTWCSANGNGDWLKDYQFNTNRQIVKHN